MQKVPRIGRSAIWMAVCLGASLFGCGGQSSTPEASRNTTTTTTTPATTTTTLSPQQILESQLKADAAAAATAANWGAFLAATTTTTSPPPPPPPAPTAPPATNPPAPTYEFTGEYFGISESHCRFDSDTGIGTYNGLITNTGQNYRHDYSLTTNFLKGGSGGTRLDQGIDFISDLNPGQSANFSTTGFSADGGDFCSLSVDTDPFG